MKKIVYPNGAVRTFGPLEIRTAAGETIVSPNLDQLLANGYRLETDAEELARETEEAVANENAAALARLPFQSATGFATQDESGHWIELLPTGDGLPIIGAQVSNSPLTPEQRETMRAERKAAHDAMKAAAVSAKTDKEKIDLLMRAMFGA